jgi:DNA repair protein RadD
MTLRPYQLDAVEGLRNSMRAKHKRILLVVPTGGGKTLIATDVIKSAVAKHRRVLFVAHRRELIEQASSKLYGAGIPHGLILSEKDESPLERVQVASVQTLESRVFKRKSKELPPADVVIFDEGHHAVSPTWLRLAESYPEAVLIGLTATPVRGDGKGLGHLYTDMVLGPSISWLTNHPDKYLVPVRYYEPSLPDLYGLKILAGDYNQKQLDERMNRPKLVGDVVANWGEIAADRKTVVFASSVDHSIHLAREFQREGVAAEHLDGKTAINERERILIDLASGRLQVVVNCAVLTEGWDMPDVSCCVLARPTKSLGLYLQCAGRVLRPAPGKADTLLIDHSGALREHGRIDSPFQWSLDTKEKIATRERKRKEKQPAKSITCEKCSAVYQGQRLCPECGHTPPRFGKAGTHLEATLQESTGKARAKRKEYSEADRKTWYVMLRYYQQSKGRKLTWVDHTFREKFGFAPLPEWRNLQPVYPSLEVSRYIRSRQIAFAKSRNKPPKRQDTPLFGVGNGAD